MLGRLPTELLFTLAALGRWFLLVLPVGFMVGTACAAFLWLLDVATSLRWNHGWLLYLLPLAGALVALLYQRYEHGAEGGSNLIVDEIHEPGAGGGGVPAKLAPLVLVGTLLTHLCGGSAGREGTALQMGGSIASAWARSIPQWLGRDRAANVRTLLMTGVAAGFGGVFGTPLAGAVFALEVPAIGRMSYTAAIPCLMAALIADRTCAMWGVAHTVYPQIGAAGGHAGGAHDWMLLAKVASAGAIFGLASRLFSELTHDLGHRFKTAIDNPVLRPVVGGFLVLALVGLVGTRDYLGLGVSSPDPSVVTILSAFDEGGAHAWSWLWKLLFTAVTLGAAFKGGEVTPLFFIGATLGNTLSMLLGAPTALFAALGFVGVFAGATNTPLACTIMAIELFGPSGALYFGVACFMAYATSGHTGIYLSQRIGTHKMHNPSLPEGASLRAARDLRKEQRAGGAAPDRGLDWW